MQDSSPRTWGCPVRPRVRQAVRYLVPTHVGVSPAGIARFPLAVPRPHARGGVPHPPAHGAALERSSPRTWGCPPCIGRPSRALELVPTHVGVSRCTAQGAARGSTRPHARGGVPAEKEGDRINESSSPRTWGCPWDFTPLVVAAVLVPTHVGVSPPTSTRRRTTPTRPHARGGVPTPIFSDLGSKGSSPRTWGCPVPRTRGRAPQALVPTHVGVSPGRRWCAPRPSARPHARGGVPRERNARSSEFVSSPRTWGCPPIPRLPHPRIRLVPTHVGVNRNDPATAILALSSSPRTWG